MIFQNSSDRQILVRHANLDEEKVIMIPGSGVDLSEYTPIPLPSGKPVIVMAARLLKAKGVGEFVSAAKLLYNKGYKVRFCVAGSIDGSSNLSISSENIRQWQEEGEIEFLGHQADMPRLLSRAHIVVLPSYYPEGLPKVLIEAAACGRAVITTDVPGCRDAIKPEETGILIPPRNAKALASAIERLLNDMDMCERMGAAGRALAERRFDIRDVIKAHLQIYNELLEN